MKRDPVLTSEHPVDIWKFFEDRARSFSHRTALTARGKSITFSELYQSAEVLATRLVKSGVNEGSTVALCLENSLMFVPAVLGLIKAGVATALISPRYGSSEMRAITEGIHPTFLLCGRSFPLELAGHIGARRFENLPAEPLFEELTLASLESPEGRTSEHTLMKVTSGSTGIPKVVALSAANIAAEAQTIVETMECTPNDKILCVTPMCHSYAFDLGVLAMLASGASLVIHDSFVPRKAMKDIAALGVTIFLGVPSIYRTLLDLRITPAPDLTTVRYMLSCTAPLSAEEIASFHSRFKVPVCQHYGSSETGAVTLHIPADVQNHPDAVGVPMKGVTVQVVDGGGLEVPAGREGEIVVTSKAVALGYVMGQPNGRSPFKGASFRMSDLGKIDNDGFLQVTGRTDDLIEIGGLKVSPQEITKVLQGCAHVREAAVLAVKDSRGESAIYAAVSLKRATTERELLAICRSQLADYKVPRRIDILQELPRTPSGKISLRKDQISL
jgi:long-chain acyl-CoA synthetase